MRLLKVNTKRLSLRVSKSDESRIIGTMIKAEILNLLEFSEDGAWVHVERETGQKGWASYKYLLGIPEEDQYRKSDPIWLKIALGELRIHDKLMKSNPSRISQYLQSCKTPNSSTRNHDESSWGSAFVNWVFEKSQYEGTSSIHSLNWSTWGKKSPKKRGAIAVFERTINSTSGNIASGHVGFYIKTLKPNRILILGANNEHKVSLSAYPILTTKYKLINFRTPL